MPLEADSTRLGHEYKESRRSVRTAEGGKHWTHVKQLLHVHQTRQNQWTADTAEAEHTKFQPEELHIVIHLVSQYLKYEALSHSW